jgi:hypothetical protein
MTLPLTARILGALAEGPKTTPELVQAVQVEGKYLGNTIRHLLRTGQISREEISKGRWRYYHGNTAPNWQGYDPAPPPPKPKPEHRIPVKTIDVARSYFGDATPIRITLPKAPWELTA